MGSLNSLCRTSYLSLSVTIALNCLVFLRKSLFKPPLATAKTASCDGNVHLFVCLSVWLSVSLLPKCKKTRFSQKLRKLELRCPLTSYRKSHMGFFKVGLPIIGALKSKMAEIRHLENRHDVIFFCRGWSDFDKILETGAEWHVDCDDVVEIENICTVCPEKKWAPPNILHWQVQTCPVLNKIKHALAHKYLSYCHQISYDSIISFNRFSIFTNCCRRFQLPTWLAYYARRTSLTSRMTSFWW